MAKETILIVDDEPDILELLRFTIEKEGYTVVAVATGEAALEQAEKRPPDLVVLDRMLPGLDGLEVCRRLKRSGRTADVPVILVTARSEDADIVTGLDVGADDYVTKPFSPRVLVARIRAVLRRPADRDGKKTDRTIVAHGIEIDTDRHQVRADGRVLDLSATEFGIFALLAREPGRVFSRSRIIDAVKGSDYPVTERAVDVQILGIRKRLGDRGFLVETVRGVGYRFREE